MAVIAFSFHFHFIQNSPQDTAAASFKLLFHTQRKSPADSITFDNKNRAVCHGSYDSRIDDAA